MNIRQRLGLGILVLSACWLEAAPHSEYGMLLAVASIIGQITGFPLLIWPDSTEREP
jgi:hypothetical protein